MREKTHLKNVPSKNNRFIEIGLDFDNNPFGLGVSSEIENPDGTEKRVRGFIPIKPRRFYLRIWILKGVFVLSTTGISFQKKNRYNLKCVFGIGGIDRTFP